MDDVEAGESGEVEGVSKGRGELKREEEAVGEVSAEADVAAR